jgi:hypothetical protein
VDLAAALDRQERLVLAAPGLLVKVMLAGQTIQVALDMALAAAVVRRLTVHLVRQLLAAMAVLVLALALQAQPSFTLAVAVVACRKIILPELVAQAEEQTEAITLQHLPQQQQTQAVAAAAAVIQPDLLLVVMAHLA